MTSRPSWPEQKQRSVVPGAPDKPPLGLAPSPTNATSSTQVLLAVVVSRTREEVYQCHDAELVDSFTVQIPVDQAEITQHHFCKGASQDAVVRGAPTPSGDITALEALASDLLSSQRQAIIMCWDPDLLRGRLKAFGSLLLGPGDAVALQVALALHLRCARRAVTHPAPSWLCLASTRRVIPTRRVSASTRCTNFPTGRFGAFGRVPTSRWAHVRILCIHVNNHVAKRKSVATNALLALLALLARKIMVSKEIDFVAGDFNGTALDDRYPNLCEMSLAVPPCRSRDGALHSEAFGYRRRVDRCMWIPEGTCVWDRVGHQGTRRIRR